jgi:hypothetical protein
VTFILSVDLRTDEFYRCVWPLPTFDRGEVDPTILDEWSPTWKSSKRLAAPPLTVGGYLAEKTAIRTSGPESSSRETGFASVAHPNSVTGRTGLLGLDDLFGITSLIATSKEFGTSLCMRELLLSFGFKLVMGHIQSRLSQRQSISSVSKVLRQWDHVLLSLF